MAKGTKKQNLTVSLDQQTIRRAKVLAARQSTSISGLVARQIEILSEDEAAYERSERQAALLLDRGFHLGIDVKIDRDELHER